MKLMCQCQGKEPCFLLKESSVTVSKIWIRDRPNIKSVINEDPKDVRLREYQDEISKLKFELKNQNSYE